jgi:hypothetical protein
MPPADPSVKSLASGSSGCQPAAVTDDGWEQRLARAEFPRSSGYPAGWILENHMGPHPLWLIEALCQQRAPTTGSTVLDLGCGKALTSVFLAREDDGRVVAADWWIPPGRTGSDW